MVYCAVVNKYYLKLCFRKYIRLGVMNYDNKSFSNQENKKRNKFI